MNRWSIRGFLLGVLVAGGSIVAAQAAKDVVVVDSATAQYKEVVAGVSKAAVWGDPVKGPYGAFTRFKPGVNNALHIHTNDLRVLVLKGAYVFKPENGPEKRIGPGQYLFLPGGTRHVSGGDEKEGALFYEESQGAFDLNIVKVAGY